LLASPWPHVAAVLVSVGAALGDVALTWLPPFGGLVCSGEPCCVAVSEWVAGPVVVERVAVLVPLMMTADTLAIFAVGVGAVVTGVMEMRAP
jgi:hypothetical protein